MPMSVNCSADVYNWHRGSCDTDTDSCGYCYSKRVLRHRCHPATVVTVTQNVSSDTDVILQLWLPLLKTCHQTQMSSCSCGYRYSKRVIRHRCHPATVVTVTQNASSEIQVILQLWLPLLKTRPLKYRSSCSCGYRYSKLVTVTAILTAILLLWITLRHSLKWERPRLSAKWIIVQHNIWNRSIQRFI